MSTLPAEERSVEARSAALTRELGVSDLVFTQILFVVGLPWVGVAAKLGPSHVVFWTLAIVLFYLPSAVVVTYLKSPDAARGRALPVGEDRVQRAHGVSRGLEPVALRDPEHVGGRAAG